MKKILFCLILFFLVGCWSGPSNEDIQNAKNDILSWTQDTQTTRSENDNLWVRDIKVAEWQLARIIEDTSWIIQVTPVDVSEINSEEIKITGTVQNTVNKITVKFSNETSDYPLDVFTLENFIEWDTTFTFYASSRQRSLDFWKNEYLLTAYTPEETAETIVSIYLDKDEVQRKEALQWTWGEGVLLDEGSVVSGLTMKKVDLQPLDCSMTDSITEFLLGQYSWAYWNTCRDLVKEKSIYFNVLRLDGDQYIYERHFYDFTNGFYGILTLETGTGIDKTQMWDKNKQLKESDFEEQTQDAMEYFKNIWNSQN